MTRPVLLLISIFVLATYSPAQERFRAIDEAKPFENAPLVIVEKRVKEKRFSGKPYMLASPDWLKDVAIEVRNESKHTIIEAMIEVEVMPEGRMRLPIAFNLRLPSEAGGKFQRSLPPGETAVMTVPDGIYKTIMVMIGTYDLTEFDRLTIRVASATFDNRSRWTKGFRLRQDPADANKWVREDLIQPRQPLN